MKRRWFLTATIAGAGGLVLGWRAWDRGFDARARQLAEQDGGTLLAGWLKIGADDTVTVYVPHTEMGQGVHTALAMMAAEELDVDWAQVRAAQAPADRAFANRFLAEGWTLQDWSVPGVLNGVVDAAFAAAARFIDLQQTGGSTAVRLTGQVGMRLVGAAARQMLIQAASRRWGVPAGALVTAGGRVIRSGSGQSVRYGELAAEAAELSVPASPPLKPRQRWRIIGTAVPRLDIPAKVAGAFGYGIDLALPEMRVATVTAAPVPGGRLLSVDPVPALAVAGVERVVRLDDAVAVIARDTWSAKKGLAALAPRFSDAGHGGVSCATIDAAQDRALAAEEGEARVTIGDAAAALAQAPADRIVEAAYRVPHLHHAAMEPITVTAQLADGRLTVWAGDHNPLTARRQLVELSGLAAEDVTLVPLPMGGSFGRRGGRDDGPPGYFVQTVALARAAAPHPVKLVWSREEDFAQGTFRPRLACRIRAALAPDGSPLAWSQLYVDGMPAPVEAFRIPYAVLHQSIRAVAVPDPVRRGSWRSVNHTQHAFWSESFIDELAHAAGRDPFAYRRDLLPPGSRHRRVLEAAAEAAGWGAPLPAGSGRGIAVAEAYGTVVAHVIEASPGPGGRPVVHRVIAAVDCGDVCNPDTARQQVEGAVVMGLSAAIAERITVEGGAVVQRNFPDYPLLGLAGTPEIEVRFLRSDGPWGGLGEPGLPPVAPALANALFAATQHRCRSLPLTDVLI